MASRSAVGISCRGAPSGPTTNAGGYMRTALPVLLLIISAAAAAQSRTLTAQDVEEMDAIDRQLAPSACEGMKLYIEAIAAASVGDAAKAQEVEARMAKAQRPPELEVLARRKN